MTSELTLLLWNSGNCSPSYTPQYRSHFNHRSSKRTLGIGHTGYLLKGFRISTSHLPLRALKATSMPSQVLVPRRHCCEYFTRRQELRKGKGMKEIKQKLSENDPQREGKRPVWSSSSCQSEERFRMLTSTYTRKYFFGFVFVCFLTQNDCFELIHLPTNFILKISLCKCTTLSLSIHHLIDIKVISSFWI